MFSVETSVAGACGVGLAGGAQEQGEHDDDVGEPADQLQHRRVGVMLKMPWMISPYQDDQSNPSLMSKALAPSPGSQPTVCRAPMP